MESETIALPVFERLFLLQEFTMETISVFKGDINHRTDERNHDNDIDQYDWLNRQIRFSRIARYEAVIGRCEIAVFDFDFLLKLYIYT